MSLNLFPMPNLRPNIEFMQLLRMGRHCRHKSRLKRFRAPKVTAFYRKTAALNANLVSDFEPSIVILLKLRMRSRKSPKYTRKATSDGQNVRIMRDIGLPNLFPVTNVRPDV